MRGFVLAASSVVALLGVGATCVAASAVQVSGTVDVSDLDPPPPAVPLSTLRAGVDSVYAAPGAVYPASGLYRIFFGDLNRELWRIPFRLAVLRLDTLGGGVTVQELSGGKQTLGIRLIGRDSVIYQFRSIVKNALRAVPELLHETVAGYVVQDQMAAQFPLGAMVVAELLVAVDVLVAKPTPVVMPDDARLGEFRSAFAGRMGWIEVRPDEREGDRPGFAGSTKITGTDELYEELKANPASFVNAHAFLRARLIDILVGDWDRHADQWRWARYPDGDRLRWDPIPRDRDWAFSRIDGVATGMASAFYPQYVGFSSAYPDIVHLSWASQDLDRTLLSSLDRRAFTETAASVAATLTDEVLQDAVAVLPPPYHEAGEAMLHALRLRRNALVHVATEFYELLANEPGIRATEHADSATITSDGRSVRVQVHAGANRQLRLDRTFLRAETDEVRLYLLAGEDVVVVPGPAELPIAVRISTGAGPDRIIDLTSGENVYVYNSAGADENELGAEAFTTDSEHLIQDSVRTARMMWNERDWGSAWVPRPSARKEDELGLLVGAKISRYGFGFGQHDCRSCVSLEVLSAIEEGEWIADLDMDRLIGPNGWWLTGSITMHTGRPTWFYGFGNDLPRALNEEPHMGFRHTIEVRPGIRYAPERTWYVDGGLALRTSGEVVGGGEIFDSIGYGTGRMRQIGLRGGFALDSRDDESLPTSGAVAHMDVEFHPTWLDIEDTYGSMRASLRSYHSARLPLDPALHVRLVGEKVWGLAPYAETPVLGGALTLPGFARSQFRGSAMASATALLRARAFSANVFTALDFGVHGMGGLGRVWYPGERSATWHRSRGAGLWLHIPTIDRTLSVTFVRGDRLRTYVDFGWIF